MIVDLDYAVKVFKKIRNFRQHHKDYWLNGEQIPLMWDRVAAVAKDMYEFEIKVFEVSASVTGILGTLLRYDGTKEKPHIILVRAGLSEEHKNFAITKELSHLIIDEREDWSPDGPSVIKGMHTHFLLEKSDGVAIRATKTTASEAFAEFVATQLLYPYHIQKGDIQKRRHPETYKTVRKIALEHKLPAVMVEMALSDWYQTMCEQVWGIIENENNT